MPRHKETGDLSHPLQQSLPSTQARQRFNWFSIVNLRRVCKENARSVKLLLQRPQGFLKLFPVHWNKPNGDRRHVHFFFFFFSLRLFFSVEWWAKIGLTKRDFFWMISLSVHFFLSTGSCRTFAAAICLAQQRPPPTSILDTTWFGGWQTAGSVSQA